MLAPDVQKSFINSGLPVQTYKVLMNEAFS